MDKVLFGGLFIAELGNAIISKVTKKEYELLAVKLAKKGINSYNDLCKTLALAMLISGSKDSKPVVVVADVDYREVK